SGKLKSGAAFTAVSPETDNRSMVGTLLDNHVKFDGKLPKETPWPLQLLFNAFPILLLIAVWVYFMRQMQGAGGGRGAMSFGK
ncbi:ATP-dependent metalloprotease, partial [Acinetobacter baumannii]